MLTATRPQTRHFQSLSPHGFHRVVYHEWGAPDNPRVVLCVHGIGRNARDFDVLGETLSATHRVVAIDMPGRGESDWLADPNDYVVPVYLATLSAMIARTGAETVDWVGTSMGGLLGMIAAAQPKAPIARLVVNDVGPVVEPGAIARIAEYFGTDPTFDSFEAILRYIREISAPFGPLTDAQWEYVARTNVRQRADGRWGLAYDPGIAVPFRQQKTSTSLWGLWDAIRIPTLVLRGSRSDLLSPATAAEMSARGPRPRVVEFEGVGHAPMLFAPEQIEPVVAFLHNEPSSV
jgi:pimeloyl-ACP methyl ester carboxylesterase